MKRTGNPDEYTVTFTDVECVTLRRALAEAALSNAIYKKKFGRAGQTVFEEAAANAETSYRYCLEGLEAVIDAP